MYKLNRNTNVVFSTFNMSLHNKETNLLLRALEIIDKQIIELMILFKSTYIIDYDEKLDKSKLHHIINKGYSRIPVYGGHNK